MDTGIRFILILIGALLLIAIIWDVVKKRESNSKTSKHTDGNSLDTGTNQHKEPKLELKNEIIDDSITRMSDNATDITRGEISTTTDNYEIIPEQTNATNTDIAEGQGASSKKEAPKTLSSISISIVSIDQKGFPGERLLDALKAVYMYHGDMNIFHRFKFNDGTGDVLFSMASATEPGTFDKDTINSEFFPGITLFFAVEQVKDAEESLDSMLKYAKQLAFRLNGQLLDQYHKPLTINQIEDYKENLKRVVNR